MELYNKNKPSKEEVASLLEHYVRHGFDERKMIGLDQLQIIQFLKSCKEIFKRTSPSYPSLDIPGHYNKTEMELRSPSQEVLEYVFSKLLEDIRVPPRKEVKGCVPKHHKRKPVLKGSGSTQAVLAQDMMQCLLYMELLLVYHSFCHFSSSLPNHLRTDYETIDYGGKAIFFYTDKILYRGDNTLDFRTTKMHCQERTGRNYKCLGSLMHTSCHLGERLLKTEAKGISKTAQKRGQDTFLLQTCKRIEENLLMDRFSCLQERIDEDRRGESDGVVCDR